MGGAVSLEQMILDAVARSCYSNFACVDLCTCGEVTDAWAKIVDRAVQNVVESGHSKEIQ